MDSINIYPTLATWQANPKGECMLHLSIDVNSKRAGFPSLKKKILPKHWDADNKRVRKSHPSSESLNTVIAREKNRIEADLLAMQAKSHRVTVAMVKAYLKGKSVDSVLGFFRDFIDYHSEDRKDKTSESGSSKKFSDNNIKKWEVELRRLKEFSNNDLTFSDITTPWLKRYEADCAKGLDKSTSLPITMSRLLQVLRKAAGQKLFDMSVIHDYKLPTYKNPERPYLTVEQTDAIATLVYDGSLDYDPALKATACYFLVECWAGLRFSDWPRFIVERLIEKDSIKVQAQKNKQPVYVPISSSPRLKRIIKYIQDNDISFNLTEQHTNRLLKTVTSLAKIPFKVTTHVGRHTCATLLLEIGYTEEAIAAWLGISMATVKIYAKNTRRKIQNEYSRLGGL